MAWSVAVLVLEKKKDALVCDDGCDDGDGDDELEEEEEVADRACGMFGTIYKSKRAVTKKKGGTKQQGW